MTKRKFRIKGISANGAVARDLFAFRPTGVSLESLREAVAAFLALCSVGKPEAMSGAFDPVSPFYYRIYSPVIFIEFYHEPGIALPNTG